MISSGALAGLAKVGLVVVAVGGLSAGAYFAYQTGPGGSDGTSVQAGATAPASPTAPQATLTPTTEAPTPQPTPSPLPSATSVPTLPPTQPPPTEAPTVDPDCAKRTHNHLNIDKLRLDPRMNGATITEVDDRTIQIEIDGLLFTVDGWGEVMIIGIPRGVSDSLDSQITGAAEALRYEC